MHVPASASHHHCFSPVAGAEFPAEAGRYHLYVSLACPFACRALAARNLRELQDVISISVAHPVFQKTKPDDANDDHRGWVFVDPAEQTTITGVDGNEYSTAGCIPDTVLNTKFVRDIYELVDKAPPHSYSVPLLWDKKRRTMVSNESADILRMFNSGFQKLVPPNVDLLPDPILQQIEKMNAGVVESISSGMFKVLTAMDSESRAQEFANLFAHIQTADDLLAKSRFLVGDTITEADIRLFHTLIRFDVYQLECDKFVLSQYPNLLNIPALRATVNWGHIQMKLASCLPNAIVSGPLVDYEAAHDRATRFDLSSAFSRFENSNPF